MTHRVLRSELSTVYIDPTIGPRDILAYCPENHASPNCERALRGGRRGVPIAKTSDTDVWCPECTTTDPEKATLRLVDGQWKET